MQYVRLVDNSLSTHHDGVELARYTLDGSVAGNALIFAALHREPQKHGGGWKLHALGEPATGRTASSVSFQRAVAQAASKRQSA